MGRYLWLSHMLFVNDVLMFIKGSLMQEKKDKELMDTYSTTTYMEINVSNSIISCNGVDISLEKWVLHVFPLKSIEFQVGFKYQVFPLNPNGYGKKEWEWSIQKIEDQIFGVIYSCQLGVG